MRKRTQQSRRLSVYLIKDEYSDFSSVLKEKIDGYDVKNNSQVIGKLFIKPLRSKCPTWFSFFDGFVPSDLRSNLIGSTVSAIFLLKRNNRIYAFTFGYGRCLLKQNCWEERFGLKVVLNSIDRDKIRIIDRKNLDTMLTQTRTQTSRKCAIEEFNLDVQQILLKAVTGEPRDESFAQSISGADALSIHCAVTLDTIEGKCDALSDAFSSLNYQKTFPWVNNVAEVTNKQTIENLNAKLVQYLQAGNYDRLFLAVPDIVEWTSISGFQFSEKDQTPYPDILLPDFLNTVRSKENLSCQYLKQRHVFQVYADTGVSEARWSVFHCLNCELSDGGQTFILTESKWYEVENSFVCEVNNQIKAISKSNIDLAAAKNEREPDYCQRLYEKDKDYYAMMHGKMIWHGGGHSQIEFCDLFSNDGKIIHLKRYGGASVLSHLFAQGVNSAKILLSDIEFRRKVNKELPKTHKFNDDAPITAKDYEVVFGIISETANELPEKLPFFSKLTLSRAVQELQGIMGFKASLAGISITKQ